MFSNNVCTPWYCGILKTKNNISFGTGSTFVGYILIISLNLVMLHRLLWLLEVLLLFAINSHCADLCQCFGSNVLFLKPVPSDCCRWSSIVQYSQLTCKTVWYCWEPRNVWSCFPICLAFQISSHGFKQFCIFHLILSTA